MYFLYEFLVIKITRFLFVVFCKKVNLNYPFLSMLYGFNSDSIDSTNFMQNDAKYAK